MKARRQPFKIKLVFNPESGIKSESSEQLLQITRELESMDPELETFIIQPDNDLTEFINNSIKNKAGMIVVCGGDGTISAIARLIIGTSVTMGIIPTGSQNNIALSLGIPDHIPDAIALLKNGRKSKIDIGICTYEGKSFPFIEICAIGLISNLFSSGEDIQHGDFSKIGDFLITLAITPPSEILLFIDGKEVIHQMGHLAIVTNTQYVIHHYPAGSANSLYDGLLNVLFFADLTKLDLFSYMLKGPGTSMDEDPRILHFKVSRITIKTNPAMPIMIDGMKLGEGNVEIRVKRRGMKVMTPQAVLSATLIPEKSGS